MHNYNQEEFKPVSVSRVGRQPQSKAFSSFIDGITLTVVGLLVVVIVLLYLTTITFNSNLDLLRFGFQSLVLYLASLSIYFLLRSFAKRKGRATKGFQDAVKTIEANNNKIVETGAAEQTTKYCREWETAELNNSRERILADVGITLETFEEKYQKYSAREIKKKFPELSEAERKAVVKARKLKRLHYDENYLSVNTSYGRRKAPNQYITTRSVEIFNGIIKAVTMLLTALFGVTLCVNVATSPTFETIVMCLVKIIIVLISGAVGMAGGYSVTSVKAVEEMGLKIDEQRRFMKWCGVDLEEIKQVSSEDK